MAKLRLTTLFFGSGVTVVSVGLALALTANFEIIGGHVPLVLFAFAVGVSTWYGGRIAGVAATILSGMSLAYFILPGFYSARTADAKVSVMLIFGIAATTIIVTALAFRGAKDNLRAERQRILLLFDDNPIAHIQIDAASLRILAVNQAAIDLYGYSREEAMTMTAYDLRRPEDRTELERNTAISASAGKGHFFAQHVHKSGELMNVEVYTQDIEHDGQKIREVMVIDIRDKVRADQALAGSREQLNGIISSAMDAIVSTDSSGKIVVFNEAAEKMFLYTAGEALGMDLGELIPHCFREDHTHSVKEFSGTRMHGETGSMRLQELFGLRSNGEEFPAEISISTVEIGGESLHTAIVRDITLRLKAMQAMLEAQKIYNDLAENSRDFIYTHSLDGRFISVNRFGLETSGYSLDEAISMNIADVLDPESLKKAEAIIAGILKGEMSEDRRLVVIAKDGRRFEVDANIWLIYEDGVPCGIRGIARDITSQQQALLNLRQSEERYRTLVENAQDVIFTCDIEQRFTSVNRFTSILSGFTEEELLGQSIEIIVSDEAVKLAKKIFEAKLAGEETTTYELEATAKDGRKVTVDLKTWLIYEDEKPAGIQGIARDITVQKAAQDMLKRSEEQYRTLVENAHDIIYAHDFDGNYTAINQYAADICGLTVEEVLRMNIFQSIAAEYHEIVREACEKHRRGEHVPIHQLDLIKADGQRVSISVNSWPAYVDGVPVGVEGIARDVTDLVRLEQRLREAHKLESIGTLAGGIAHDFNNLMTIVTGYSELGIRSVAPEDPVRSKFETIRDAGHKAAELTHQLLAFSRKQVLQPEPVDLNAAVRSIEKLLERLIPEHIVLITELEPQLGTIKADPSQVEQLILNLAVNARDEMPTGGKLTIRTRNVGFDEAGCKLSDQIGRGPFVMVSITDTGPGKDEETVRRVFDPYFSVQGIGHGGGLGLATVHGIVKQSGAEITVRSEIGRGTTFDVIFPATAIVGPDENTDDIGPVATGGGEVVLVVKDNEIVRPVVMEMLNSLGYVAISASGGAEAIAICQARKDPIDLLLTDVIMPEMSGKQLMDELEKLRPEIKCLFMSGYTDEIVFDDVAVDPGSAFLGKPFNASSLNEKIREVLDRGVTENPDRADQYLKKPIPHST